jgi:hypothetical protein
MHFLLHRNRTEYHTFTALQADGTEVTFESGDTFLVKIGRGNATPLLELSSDAATANGSTLAAANPAQARFDKADVNTLVPGIYDVELAIADASDQDDLKHVEKGVCTVIETQGGAVT